MTLPIKTSTGSTDAQTGELSRRHALGWMAAGAGALAAWPAQAQFKVTIQGVGDTQLPIAVVPFKGEEGLKNMPSQIVRADSERTGLFRLVDASGASMDDASRPVASDWRGRKADALLYGGVRRLADGRYDIRVRLFDVVRDTELGQQSFAVVEGDLRLASHRISDWVQEKLIGFAGYHASRIAYVQKAGPRYSLYVADADGEGAQQALVSLEPILSPAWSPDGRELAYVLMENRKPVVYVQEVSSGRRRIVAQHRGNNTSPAWSPDGQQLSVSLSRDAISQLYLIDRQGGNLRRLTQSLAIDTESTFSPDGQSIYFTSDRGGSPQIYRMSVSGGRAEQVSRLGNQALSPSISPDGQHMAYIAYQGSAYRVAILDLKSGETRIISGASDDERPSFAPNGKAVLYATRTKGRETLMISSLDGRIKASLVSTLADVRAPQWGRYVR